MDAFKVFKGLQEIEDVEVPDAYAAVCYLLIRNGDDFEVVLTRRSTKLRSHSGQVSFAGGKNDDDDLSISVTALRELREELGIAEKYCEVLGIFPERRSINDLLVFPVLVRADNISLEDICKNPDEVDEVFTVPLSELTREKAKSFDFVVFGHHRSSIHYDTPQVSIWGLTAHIIFESDISTNDICR